MRFPALLLIACVALPAGAEIYQWTDAQGRVHFGDKPVDPKVDAKEVKVKDYLPGSDEAVREVYQRRDRLREADRETAAGNAAASKAAAMKSDEEQRRCDEARNVLQRISRPVVFLDDAGKPVKVTEQERAARAAELDGWIREHCH